jgi:ABC-type transporter Mla MlaB component
MAGTRDISIRLDGEQTVRTIGDAVAVIGQALGAPAASVDSAIVLDCSDISEVDVAFIQLVLSARTSARCRGRELRLDSPARGALLTCLTDGGFLAHGAAVGTDRRAFWLMDRADDERPATADNRKGTLQ